MPCCIRNLGSESWSKGIDFGHPAAKSFSGKLPGDCQSSRSFKEVFAEICLPVLMFWHLFVFKQCCNMEHLTGPFAVRSRDDRSMHVNKPILLVE